VIFTDHNIAIAFDSRVFEVALEAEIGVALDEHLLVHRAVRVVAGGAAFAQGVVRENKGAFLGGVALGASFGLVLETGSGTRNGIALVRVMAFGAGHLAVHDGVAVREAEFAAFIEVTLETGFRGFAGVDDGACAAARLDVLAAGAVATLAAEAFGVFALDHELRMGGVIKALDGFFVALGALFGADEGGTGDLGGRCDYGAIDHGARDKKHSPSGDASENERVPRPVA